MKLLDSHQPTYSAKMHAGGRVHSLSHYYVVVLIIVLLAITIMNFNCTSVAVYPTADASKVS